MNQIDTPLPAAELDPLDLAALLCSRVCHDIIGPVFAVTSGLEFMADFDEPAMRDETMAMIQRSARVAAAKLEFSRLAFGAGGSAGAEIDLTLAGTVARNYLEGEKQTLDWQAPLATLPKNRVKLLLNLMLVAVQTIPRGGVVVIRVEGAGTDSTFRLTATGPAARIPAGTEDLVALNFQGLPDARQIQPIYTGLLARESGMRLALAKEGEAVVITAGSSAP